MKWSKTRVIIIIIIIIITIVIIIIAFKGAIRYIFFFIISSLCHEPSLTYIHLSGPGESCAYHVQHIECLSRATCHVNYHVAQRDSSAIKFNRV